MTCLCCIFESTSAILFLRALRNIATDMAGVESFEDMVGIREAAAVATDSGGAVATESGEAVATESGGALATESGGAVTTGDETVAMAGDETAAADVIMFTDEGKLEFDEDEISKKIINQLMIHNKQYTTQQTIHNTKYIVVI